MQLAAIMLGSMRNLIPLATESAAPTAPLTHDRALVALAMLLAVAGAYAALELGARSRARAACRISRRRSSSGNIRLEETCGKGKTLTTRLARGATQGSASVPRDRPLLQKEPHRLDAVCPAPAAWIF